MAAFLHSLRARLRQCLHYQLSRGKDLGGHYKKLEEACVEIFSNSAAVLTCWKLLETSDKNNVEGKTFDYDVLFPEAETEVEGRTSEEEEADLIRKAIKKHKGKRKLAANELGISERTLYRKMKELNI